MAMQKFGDKRSADSEQAQQKTADSKPQPDEQAQQRLAALDAENQREDG